MQALLFSFNGRIRRQQFWLASIGVFVTAPWSRRLGNAAFIHASSFCSAADEADCASRDSSHGFSPMVRMAATSAGSGP